MSQAVASISIGAPPAAALLRASVTAPPASAAFRDPAEIKRFEQIRPEDFVAHKEYIKSLRTHGDSELADKAIERCADMDCDEGTLGILTQELLEKPFTESDGRYRGRLTGALNRWNERTLDAELRMHTSTLAHRVLQRVLNTAGKEHVADASRSLAFLSPLLLTVARTPQPEAPALLTRLITSRYLHSVVRAKCLLHQTALGRKVPDEHRSAVIQELLICEKQPFEGEETLKNLCQKRLMTPGELAQAVGNPIWSHCALRELKVWPLTPEERGKLAPALFAVLQQVLKAGAGMTVTSRLVEALKHDAPPEIDAAIVSALAAHLPPLEGDEQARWLRQQLQSLMLDLGGYAAVDPIELAPWDQTRMQWRKLKLDWRGAMSMLASANVVEPADPQSLAEALSRARIEDGLSALLGNPRLMYLDPRDSGFEYRHGEIFQNLAQSLRPAIQLDSITQTGDTELRAMPVDNAGMTPPANAGPNPPLSTVFYSTAGCEQIVTVHYQGKPYRFLAHPEGTYSDLRAVMLAFDQFMQALGRPERVYRLEPTREISSGSGVVLFCADAARFASLNRVLALPIHIQGPTQLSLVSA